MYYKKTISDKTKINKLTQLDNFSCSHYSNISKGDTVLDLIHETIIKYNSELIIENVNSYFFHIFGYNDSILSKDFSVKNLFNELYINNIENILINHLFDKGNIDSFPAIMLTDNGDPIYADVCATAVYDYNQRPVSGILLVREKEDKRIFDVHLRDKNSPDNSIFEYANVPIFIWDKDGNFLDANSVGLKLLDYSLGLLRIHSLTEIFPTFYKEIMNQLKNNEVYQGEVTFFDKEKKAIYMEMAAFSRKTKKGILYYGICIDITERKELELLKEEHLHLINHDLKTPLTAVMGYSELLKMEFDNPKIDHLHFIEEIHTAGNQMMEMVQIIQDIQNLENKTLQLNYEKVDLITILKKAINNINIIATKKGLHIEILLHGKSLTSSDRLYFEVDSTQFLRVCDNLIKNAAESSFDDSKITISILEKDLEIEINFSNYGKSIPIEVQDKIFQKFSTYGKKTGTGLGTYGIKLITEAHKAKVFFNSNGQHTEFILLYPKKKPLV